MKHALAPLMALVLSSSALAQLSAIPPFAGTFEEGFDYPLNYGQPCLEPQLFGGQATICAPHNDEIVCALHSAGWTTTGNCAIYPHLGTHMLLAKWGEFDLEFKVPVRRFGAWFGHIIHAYTPGDRFDFYDVDGARGGVGGDATHTKA